MKTNVYEVSETITFTTQIGATSEAMARKSFIEYMGEFIPDQDDEEYGFVIKETSTGIKIKELIPCD